MSGMSYILPLVPQHGNPPPAPPKTTQATEDTTHCGCRTESDQVRAELEAPLLACSHRAREGCAIGCWNSGVSLSCGSSMLYYGPARRNVLQVGQWRQRYVNSQLLSD